LVFLLNYQILTGKKGDIDMHILKKAMAPVMLLALLVTVLALPSVATAAVATGTIITATGTGTATFSTNDGAIENLTAWPQSQLACKTTPPAYFFHGFFAFNIIRLTPGASVIITITLPSNTPTSTQYWKCINGQWVNATPILGDNDGDSVLTLTLTDGGKYDADGVANGVIVDPGGPGVPPTQTPIQQPMRVSRPDPTVSLIIVKNVSVSPQQAYAGQPITISANMANESDQIGGYTASLKINDMLEKTKLGTVDAHSAVPVDFVVTRSEPGTYSYDLGGQKGTFTVLEAQTSSGSPLSGAVIAVIVLVALVISVAVILTLTFRRTA
jgi:hypothetical protein